MRMLAGRWAAAPISLIPYCCLVLMALSQHASIVLGGRHKHQHHSNHSTTYTNGTTVQLGEELLPLINHLRQQQLSFSAPLAWLPTSSVGAQSPPPFAPNNSLLGSLLSAAGPLTQFFGGQPTPPAPMPTLSNPRHFGRNAEGEVEVSATALKAHQDPQRVLFSLMEAFWSRTLQECLHCFPTAPAAPGQQPQQQCQVKPPEGCTFPYEMLYEEARAIRCEMDVQWGEPSIKARMRCMTQPDAEIQPLIKHFPHAGVSAMPPATPPQSVPSAQNPSQMSQQNWQQQPSAQSQWQQQPGAGNQMPQQQQGAFGNNPLATQPNQPSVSQSQRKTVRIPLSREHFTRTESIQGHEGAELVRSINVSRSAISKRKLTLPTAARMGVLVWSDELAKKAHQKLGSRENNYIEVIDLQFIEMLPQFANRPPTVKFAEMSIELDFQNMLMWLVKQYFKLFASRRALRCSRNNCRPRCKGHDGQKRSDCYAYELVYDRAAVIGCAVQLHKQSGPTLRGELACVTDKEMQDGEPVYKVGQPCAECEGGSGAAGSGKCDEAMKLCANGGQQSQQQSSPNQQSLPEMKSASKMDGSSGPASMAGGMGGPGMGGNNGPASMTGPSPSQPAMATAAPAA